MRTLLTLLVLCLATSLFTQNLEVEGTVKISELVKINTADSLVVWLNDSILGIRDASTFIQQLIDTARTLKSW